MIFSPGHFWLIFINVSGWIVIHLGISFLCSKIPVTNFNIKNWIYRIRKIENSGLFYVNYFRIKKWKDLLPDGASIFRGGFKKRKLKNFSYEYLNEFSLETCRAELTHWLQILPAPLFFLWNVWWAGIIIIIYALLLNMPCILLQRYNRARLANVLKNFKQESLNDFQANRIGWG